jgi:Zinc finger, C3HC4 type (RING finger)
MGNRAPPPPQITLPIGSAIACRVAGNPIEVSHRRDTETSAFRHQFIKASDCIIWWYGCMVIGTNTTVHGANNIVTGDRITTYGANNVVGGRDIIVYSSNTVVNGARIRVRANDCVDGIGAPLEPGFIEVAPVRCSTTTASQFELDLERVRYRKPQHDDQTAPDCLACTEQHAGIVVLVPCGHRGMCVECVAKLATPPTCPLCRVAVHTIVIPR